MTRQFWVLIYRYAGLAMTLFLIHRRTHRQRAGLLSRAGSLAQSRAFGGAGAAGAYARPLRLRERAEALEPRARVDWVALHREPDEAYVVWTQPKTDPTTGEAYELPFNELLLDPSWS